MFVHVDSGWYTNTVPDSDINTQRLGDLGDCLIINRMGLSSSYCNHNLGVICQLSYQPDDKGKPKTRHHVSSSWMVSYLAIFKFLYQIVSSVHIESVLTGFV